MKGSIEGGDVNSSAGAMAAAVADSSAAPCVTTGKPSDLNSPTSPEIQAIQARATAKGIEQLVRRGVEGSGAHGRLGDLGSTPGERAKAIVAEYFGGNLSAFARELGIPQPSLHRIVEGQVKDLKYSYAVRIMGWAAPLRTTCKRCGQPRNAHSRVALRCPSGTFL